MYRLDRAEEEFVSAEILSDLGYGPVDEIQARLRGIPDHKLVGVIRYCTESEPDLNITLEDILGMDDGYADWVYEQERDKRMEYDLDVHSAYEQRVNRGAYDV